MCPACETFLMQKLLTLVLVIVAVVVAWWLVGVLFSAAWFLVRLGVVLVVAAIVYAALRGTLNRKDRR